MSIAYGEGAVSKTRGAEATKKKATSRTLAEKLDHLFTTVRPAADRTYAHQEVADAIAERGGPTISGPYLWQLRNGIRDNPTKRHIEALSAFFGVPVSYFFDDDLAAEIDEQLEIAAAFRSGAIRDTVLRLAELSPEAQRMVSDLVISAHKMELDGTQRGGSNRKSRDR